MRWVKYAGLIAVFLLQGYLRAQIITLHSPSGEKYDIKKDTLWHSGRVLALLEPGICYKSSIHRILESGGQQFLFLEVDGAPNKNRLLVYQLRKSHVRLLTDAISCIPEDMDGDGWLEFGGCELTEMHSSADSMYYIPFLYFELKEGAIEQDQEFSRLMAIQENGIFLDYPLDQNGNCCVVIPRPKK